MLNSNKKLVKLLCACVILLAVFYTCCNHAIVAVAPPSRREHVIYDNTGAQDIKQTVEPSPEVQETTMKMLIDIPITFLDVEYKALFDIALSEGYIVELTDYVSILEEAIHSGEYTAAAADTMTDELQRILEIIANTEIDAVRYAIWEQEHYYAAKTYQFLRQRGYSAEIACAIIGNMMIETSGGSLDLKPTIYNSTGGYYGLCQWSLYYRPDVADMPFEDQLEYLYADMEREFRGFSGCYMRGFTYEDFLKMTDPAEAALAFAKVYERCGSGSYGLRKTAAMVAYEYFTKEV